jgi:flagellar hook-length control protein FliK
MDAIAKSAISAGDGRYTVTLRLHPEQLGEVRLQLHVAGRDVQTVVQVNNPDVQHLVEQRSGDLRQGLSQAGLTLTGFNVTTGEGERERQSDAQPSDTLPRRRRNGTKALPIAGIPTARPTRLTTQRANGLDTFA